MNPNLRRYLTWAWQIIVAIGVVVGLVAGQDEAAQFWQDHTMGILITIGALLITGYVVLIVLIWRKVERVAVESQKILMLASASAFMTVRLARHHLDADTWNDELIVMVNTRDDLPKGDPRRTTLEEILKHTNE